MKNNKNWKMRENKSGKWGRKMEMRDEKHENERE